MNRASSATGWVRNPDGTQGYTWNPITGCLNGCEYCYARKLANGRLSGLYLSNLNIPDLIGWNAHPHDKPGVQEKLLDPFYPRFWSDRCNRIDMGPSGKPKGIFVCDMSDLFGIGIPEDWTNRVLDRCKDMSQHRFYLLTKQPQNLIKFSPFPENCWVGVTATNPTMLIEARHYLSDIETQIKYVSLEPLLEWSQHREVEWLVEVLQSFNWIILGSQTKPYKPPKWEWVSEIIDACVKANIPYFLKNNLEPIVPKVLGGDGSLIQEMPK